MGPRAEGSPASEYETSPSLARRWRGHGIGQCLHGVFRANPSGLPATGLARWESVFARTFTPSLVKFHEKNAGDDFEIVFVSSDKSEEAKAEYIEGDNMKWLTVKGHRSEEGSALSKKYSVRGIPSLIILAPDGSTITENGRGDVSGDAEGALKKWKTAAASATDSPKEKKKTTKEAKASD